MDLLTKSALVIYIYIYMRGIVRIHEESVSIVSDRDSRFMAHYWRNFQRAMGTLLRMNTMFHLHTDGQLERVIQVLEDMLRAFVLNYKDSGKGN